MPDVDGRFLGETTTPRRWDGSKLINLPRDANYARVKGTARFERWYSCFTYNVALSTAQTVANRFYAFPFVVPKAITLDRIAIFVTTTSSATKARMGIYNNDESVGMYPNALVLDSGEVNVSTTGLKDVTINQTLNVGLYWLVLLMDGVCTVRGHINIIALLGYSIALGVELGGTGVYVSYAYGALPATYPTEVPMVINYSSIPAIFVRLSA